MKDGKIKERYELSLDSRQFGLAIFGVAAVAALVFVLGISVGLQWERKKEAQARALAQPPAPPAAIPAVPPAPVAPPVYAPVTTAAAKHAEPQPDKGKKEDKKAEAAKAGKDDKKLGDLTFPKVLTSNNKNTAPLTPDKKKKTAEGRYAVQVAAYDEAAAARAKADRLSQKGYDAHVFSAPKGPYRYKVRVGGYASREEAEWAAGKLKAGEKVSPYIVKE